MNVVALVALSFLIGLSEGFLLKSHVCFNTYGCFSRSKPFTNTYGYLPDSPAKVGVSFQLYTRENQDNGVALRFNSNVSVLQNASLDWGRQLKVFVHGYMSNGKEPWVLQLVKGLLGADDYNVIVVDWRKGAKMFYPQSAANTRIVAAIISRMMTQISAHTPVGPQQIHLIGHSLGAHICGYVGSRIQNISRITGLDPAGPLFAGTNPAVRLDPTDAKFVDAIHTDGVPIVDLGFGTLEQMGDIDFYPNGGGRQPGCPPPVKTGIDELFTFHFQKLFSLVACSHSRSHELFTESLKGGACVFQSYPCSSYSAFKADKCTTCSGGDCPVLGLDSIESPLRGKFYLKTHAHYPYCISSKNQTAT